MLVTLLITLLCANLIVGQEISATTLAATACASPSCTVTPTILSPITIQPSPTTVNAPGASLPITFTFDRITISSFRPDPTVLSNPGSGFLTLEKTTITNLRRVTATQSYIVEPSQTLSVVVIVDVQAEAQLFFAQNNDPDSICNLDSGVSKLRSRITGQRSIGKRNFRFDNNNAANTNTFITDAVAEANIVLDTFLDYFSAEHFPQLQDIPNNVG